MSLLPGRLSSQSPAAAVSFHRRCPMNRLPKCLSTPMAVTACICCLTEVWTRSTRKCSLYGITFIENSKIEPLTFRPENHRSLYQGFSATPVFGSSPKSPCNGVTHISRTYKGHRHDPKQNSVRAFSHAINSMYNDPWTG